MYRQLWVFRVSGGDSFDIQVKGNPIMRHDGGPERLLQTLCTKEQADELVKNMRSYGSTVEAHCSQETSEQKAERKNVMQVVGGNRPFPCQRCPECAWFDPRLDSLCGAGLAFGQPGWDESAIQGVMASTRYQADFEACPLQEGPNG